MAERSQVLQRYQQTLKDLWARGRGHLRLEDVRSLQVYCQMYALNLDEHEASVDAVGVDRRELLDEYNHPFADWLRERRTALTSGRMGLRFAVKPAAPWKKKLPAPPSAWQNALAGLAGLLVIASIVLLVLLQRF